MEFEFQVDEEYWSDKLWSNIIIGNNLLWNMGMDIRFSNADDWDGKKISMKTNGAIEYKEIYKMLYSIFVKSPIIKEAKERIDQILESDFFESWHKHNGQQTQHPPE